MTPSPHPARRTPVTPAGGHSSRSPAGKCTACGGPRTPNCCTVSRMAIRPLDVPRNSAEEILLTEWKMHHEPD